MAFMYIIVGLGNPGQEYVCTRHNTGRIVLGKFVKDFVDGEVGFSKKYKALVGEGKIKKEKFTILFPETFMNKSGASVAPLVTSKKKAEQLVVVYDDLDLPLGKIKISWNRGSGGHKGLESIIRAVKTKEFLRIRVGTSPATPSGKLKKPHGEKEVERFILGDFSKKEDEVLKKVSKEVAEAIETLVTEGRGTAMSVFN
jgi:PTH1 family peptidyl-tRNA hydrolase